MRSLKTTVPAFTIMEVTISMLVAAIVIAMTYSAYGIITKSWLGFTDKNQKMAVVLRLNGLLCRDFEKASFIEQEKDGILIQIGGHPVRYQIRPEQVLRISSITDTFKVNSSALKEYFEGNELNIAAEDDGFRTTSDAENSTDSQGQQPIDEISFAVSLQNTVIPFHYKKHYDAESLMAIKP